LIDLIIFYLLENRVENDLITTLYGIHNLSQLTTTIRNSDLAIFKKDILNNKQYDRKVIFLYYVREYLPNVIIKEPLLLGFEGRFKTVNTTNTGFDFAIGTSVSEALSTIASGLDWYVDNLNTLWVVPKPTTDFKFQPDFPGDRILLNQSTGLLDVPVLGLGATIKGKALLNAAIVPNAKIRVQTQRDIARAAGGAAVQQQFEDSHSASLIDAVVMTSTFIGDSRVGSWVVQWETYPLEFVSVL